MRLFHIACVVTPDNAYGGPVTVALAHCHALMEMGHDPLLIAGCAGFDGPLPTELEGVPVRLFPVHKAVPGTGFAGLVAPRMLSWLNRNVRTADAVHVHLARDLVTLPAAVVAQKSGVPTYVQTHGMIDLSERLLAKPLDALLTRRVLKKAAKVFYLTDVEAEGILQVAGSQVGLQELRNGINVEAYFDRGARGESSVVLFLARIQKRKRPLTFVEVACALHKEFPSARFVMVGPDEDQGEEVRRAIQRAAMGDRLTWLGAATPMEAKDYFHSADIYVLPSVNEPYPMSVLEALAASLPVVITDSNGLAEAVAEADAGIVVEADVASVTRAVRELLVDRPGRLAKGHRAYQLAEGAFSMPPIVEKLLCVYGGTQK